MRNALPPISWIEWHLQLLSVRILNYQQSKPTHIASSIVWTAPLPPSPLPAPEHRETTTQTTTTRLVKSQQQQKQQLPISPPPPPPPPIISGSHLPTPESPSAAGAAGKMATTTANSLQTYHSSLMLITSPSPPPAPLLVAAAALHATTTTSSSSPGVSTIIPAPAPSPRSSKSSCSPSLPNPSSTLLRQTLTCHVCTSPRYPPSSHIKNRFFVDTSCHNDSPVCAKCGHKCVGCAECREHYWVRVWECWACGGECLRGGCRCGMGWTEGWTWGWRMWRVMVEGKWRAVGEEGGEWRLD